MNRYAIPIAVLSLSFVTGTVLYREISSSRERRVVETEFFTPYFKAISEGRYSDAWTYHSPAWRSQHSLAEFKGHYQTMIRTKGDLVQRSLTGISSAGQDLTVEYQIGFGSDFVAVTYELVPQPEQGRWGIGNAVSTGGNRTLPW